MKRRFTRSIDGISRTTLRIEVRLTEQQITDYITKFKRIYNRREEIGAILQSIFTAGEEEFLLRDDWYFREGEEESR